MKEIKHLDIFISEKYPSTLTLLKKVFQNKAQQDVVLSIVQSTQLCRKSSQIVVLCFAVLRKWNFKNSSLNNFLKAHSITLGQF